jgi:hypothetical protein
VAPHRSLAKGALLPMPLPENVLVPLLVAAKGRSYDAQTLFPLVDHRIPSDVDPKKPLHRTGCPVCEKLYPSVDGAASCLLSDLGLSYRCGFCPRTVHNERVAVECMMGHYLAANAADPSLPIPTAPSKQTPATILHLPTDQRLDPLRRHLAVKNEAAAALERLDQRHYFPITVASVDCPSDADASLSFELGAMLPPLQSAGDIPFDPVQAGFSVFE